MIKEDQCRRNASRSRINKNSVQNIFTKDYEMTLSNSIHLTVALAACCAISACTVHGSSPSNTPAAGIRVIQNGDQAEAFPTTPASPGSAPGSIAVDLAQCPTIDGHYENREIGFPLSLDIGRGAGNTLTISMTGSPDTILVDGQDHTYSDGAEILATCKDGLVDMSGKKASQQPLHTQYKKVDGGVYMYDLNPNQPTQITNGLVFKAK
jgi:hypothetical protein